MRSGTTTPATPATPATPTTPAATTASPSTAATPTSYSDAEAEALGAVLAAEHAAVYAYGVVGAWCDDRRRPLAEQRLQQHAARRDLLAARLTTAKRTAPAAEPAYALPFPVDSPATAVALAAHVEVALAAVNADLVAASAAARRWEAARWLAENSVAARRWGAADTAFPGLPERAGTA